MHPAGMTPDEVSAHLRAVANYIEQEDSPEIERVSTAIQGLLTTLSPRNAGDLKKFMAPEIDGFVKGLDGLINRLKKVVQTLNPQDEAYGYLVPTLKDWEKIHEDMSYQIEDFENVSI